MTTYSSLGCGQVLLLSVVTWSLEFSLVSQVVGMGKTGEMQVGDGHPVPTVVRS